MTGKLRFVPDTHVVVPKEPADEYWLACDYNMIDKADENYELVIKTAPQLTTPPVLRWEGGKLMIGNMVLHTVRGNQTSGYGSYTMFYTLMSVHPTEQEARRAAEAALGLPKVDEV